jgi:hypothetical protein
MHNITGQRYPNEVMYRYAYKLYLQINTAEHED